MTQQISTKDQLKKDFDQKYALLKKHQELLDKIEVAALGEQGEMRSVWTDLTEKTLAAMSKLESELRAIANEYKKVEKSTSL